MWKHKGNQLQFPGPSSPVLPAVCTAPLHLQRCLGITAATTARAGKKRGGEKGKEMAEAVMTLLKGLCVSLGEPLLFKKLLEHPGGRLSTGRGRNALSMGQAEEVRQK